MQQDAEPPAAPSLLEEHGVTHLLKEYNRMICFQVCTCTKKFNELAVPSSMCFETWPGWQRICFLETYLRVFSEVTRWKAEPGGYFAPAPAHLVLFSNTNCTATALVQVSENSPQILARNSSRNSLLNEQRVIYSHLPTSHSLGWIYSISFPSWKALACLMLLFQKSCQTFALFTGP